MAASGAMAALLTAAARASCEPRTGPTWSSSWPVCRRLDFFERTFTGAVYTGTISGRPLTAIPTMNRRFW